MKEQESMKSFQIQIQTFLNQINPELLCDPVTGTESYAEVYRFIALHAENRKLRNTAIALPMVRWCMLHKPAKVPLAGGNQEKQISHLNHAFAICRMLIDLHLPLKHDEEDVILASALCHILPIHIIIDNLESEMKDVWTLSPDVYGILRIIDRDNIKSEEELAAWADTIQRNKLALMLKLADRGNLVESLVVYSSLRARNFIYETRNFFFPMCIYGKEHYPELLWPISVLMEKMRCLTEVTEILLSRYETRETELLNEIQSLREENVLIRNMIQSLQ